MLTSGSTANMLKLHNDKNGFSMIFNRKSLNDSSPFFQAVLFQIVQELVSLRHDLLDFHSFSMRCI